MSNALMDRMYDRMELYWWERSAESDLAEREIERALAYTPKDGRAKEEGLAHESEVTA